MALAMIDGCARVRPNPDDLARLQPALAALLLVGFNGVDVDGNRELERLLCEARVGGVLIFARNIVDPAQLRRLTRGIGDRALACAGRRPLIAVDGEGGRIMRLSPRVGFPPTLSHRELGEDNDFAETKLEARRIGGILRVVGIDWNLAPVVDVGYNPANPVIVGHGRSFGANPRLVAAHARAYVTGMRAAGIRTTLKHFPGHGSSATDSHLGFVDVSDTANAEIELLPYRALIAEGLADSIMTAHVFNRRLDRRYPATLSRATITGLLRETLGFGGPVVSDDLRMGAIDQHYGLGDAAVLAARAGVDVLLVAEDALPDGRSATAVVIEALREALADGRVTITRIDEALARMRQFSVTRGAAARPPLGSAANPGRRAGYS